MSSCEAQGGLAIRSNILRRSIVPESVQQRGSDENGVVEGGWPDVMAREAKSTLLAMFTTDLGGGVG